MILVFILPSGTTADCPPFKLLTSASSSALRFCNCSTARSSFSSRSNSEAVAAASGPTVASSSKQITETVRDEYLLAGIVSPNSPKDLADCCWFRSLATLKSDCVPQLLACCQAAPVFRRTPPQAESIGTEKAGVRSEERRVGKECALLCRSRWSP